MRLERHNPIDQNDSFSVFAGRSAWKRHTVAMRGAFLSQLHGQSSGDIPLRLPGNLVNRRRHRVDEQLPRERLRELPWYRVDSHR